MWLQVQFQVLDWSVPSLESGSLELSLELGLCLELFGGSSVPASGLQYLASELLSPEPVLRFPESDSWFQAEPCRELLLILEWWSFRDSCFAQVRCFDQLSSRRNLPSATQQALFRLDAASLIQS